MSVSVLTEVDDWIWNLRFNRMEKTFESFAGTWVRIPGRVKWLLKTIAVNARVNHELYQYQIEHQRLY